MESLTYLNQPDCLRLANKTVEAVVTTAIGPRILRYGFLRGENILAELPDAVVKTDFGDWKPWGGHRLWTAPEQMPRSYEPDNEPIGAEKLGARAVRLVQGVEPATGVRKYMTVGLDATGTRLVVHHKIVNRNYWAITLAPWALTIMSGGGCVILPQEPYRSHADYLLPARAMVLWHYTDLNDPRYAIGPRYLRLRTDAGLDTPQKIGIANKQGWAAYFRQGTLFVKTFEYDPEATYPDGGCNCETFTKGDFMELETLGPLVTIAPFEAAEHVEQWRLFRGVDIGDTEASLDRALRSILAKIKNQRNRR